MNTLICVSLAWVGLNMAELEAEELRLLKAEKIRLQTQLEAQSKQSQHESAAAQSELQTLSAQVARLRANNSVERSLLGPSPRERAQ